MTARRAERTEAPARDAARPSSVGAARPHVPVGLDFVDGGHSQVIQRQVSRHEDVLPSTRLGIFDSEYDPATRVLTVTLRVYLEFMYHGSSALEQHAYRDNWAHIVQRFWSRRYRLQRVVGGRRQRTDVEVRVQHMDHREDADLHIRVMREAQPQRDYVSLTRSQRRGGPDLGLPPDPDRFYVTGRASESDEDHAPDMSFGFPARQPLPTRTFTFAPRGPARRDLDGYVRALRARTGLQHIEVRLVGRPGPGETGRDAFARARDLRERLTDLMVATDRRNVERITFVAVVGQPAAAPQVETMAEYRGQPIVAHETGHAFGLGDEYAEAGRRQAGDQARHSALAQRLGMPPVVVGQDPDSIMASGTALRPHHYVTFAEDLHRHTGGDPWTVVP